MSLVEFLLARIAEDEARASVEVLRIDFRTHPDIPSFSGDPYSDAYADYIRGLRRIYPDVVGPSDPRVLAECEAKRRIVEIAVGPWDAATINRAVDLNQRGSTVVGEDGEEEAVAEWTTTRLLRALAAVYAEHPDYRPEWKL